MPSTSRHFTLHRQLNSTSFLRLYFIPYNLFSLSAETLSRDLQNCTSESSTTRVVTTRAPLPRSRVRPAALRRSLILYVHEPSRSLWPHKVGRERKKDPARGDGGIHHGPKFRISSQSACCVNTDWTRPGVARSRLRPIYRLFAVSSLSGTRERSPPPPTMISRRLGQLMLVVRCESDPGTRFERYGEWSHRERRSSGTSRGYRTSMIEEICRGNRSGIETPRSRNRTSTSGRIARGFLPFESSREFKMIR